MAIDLEFLRELDKFQLALKRQVHSQYQGERDTEEFGEGLVFRDFRQYVPGDDIRFIDWTVYARTNDYYIKRFEEERNLTVHILVDSSASMAYGSDPAKFDYASMVGLGFAYMAMNNNERFNFNTFAEEVEMIRPKKGVDQLMSIVDRLNKKEPTGRTEALESLQTYKSQIRSKSMIVLVSDFLYPVEEFRDVIERFRKSEIVVVQTLDPSERELRVRGDVLLEDAETDERMRTFLSRRSVSEYQSELEEHIAQLRNICKENQAEFVTTTTNVPVFDVFYEVITRHEQKNLA